MADRNNSAEDRTIVARDRVIEWLRFELHRAVHVERRFTVKEIGERSGVSVRRLTCYISSNISEQREAMLSAAMSVAVVLGTDAVNRMLALIGYGGATPLDEVDDKQPMQVVAGVMAPLNVIVQAAANNRWDADEKDPVREAADLIITHVLPLSSHGEAA